MSAKLFTHPNMLYALLAAAIPVIIHLLLRMRKKEVKFGSLMFIQKIMRQNKKSLRLKEYLLLFLRTLIIILLVFAFARPTEDVTSDGNFTEGAVVYILDDTLSMSATELGRTNFEKAKAAIISHSNNLKGNAPKAFFVLSSPQKPRMNFTKNKSAFQSKLRSVSQKLLHGKLAPAIQSGVDYLNTAGTNQLTLALATDGQNSMWSEGELQSLPLRGINVISLLSSQSISNIAILSAKTKKANTAKLTATVEVKLANYGDAKIKGHELALFIGSNTQPAKRTLVSLAPNSTKTIELTITHIAAGRFPAQITLTPTDALPQDNQRAFVIEFATRREALIIQDELLTQKSRYSDKSYFLSRAINPDETTPSQWRSRIVTTAQLNTSDIKSADAIFLLSSTQLPQKIGLALQDFTKHGGGLIYAPPINSPPASLAPTLPFAKLKRCILQTNSADAKAYSIKEIEHPIFAPFKEQDVSGLEHIRFTSLRVLEPSKSSSVIAQLDNQHPALIDTQMGRGKILELAFDFTSTHSDFPKRTSFVPFVQSLLKYATTNKKLPRILSIELGAIINPPDINLDTTSGYTIHSLTSPNNSALNLEALETHQFNRRGVYTMRSNTTGRMHFVACNLPLAEFNLKGQLPDTLINEEPQKINGNSKISQTTTIETRPSSVWAVLLAVVLGIMLIESLLANAPLGASKNSGDEDVK